MSERRIGRYIVKGILGEGAMGSVIEAHDPNLERPVAIKTMRTGKMKKSEYAEFKERFFLEARANGRLNHPNIVAVYDSGLENDEPYLVMELVRGAALDHFIDDNYQKRLKHYLPLMEQIAAGLDYAHEEGVIHRDVKPGNILVLEKTRKPRVKILDFGLAKLKDSKLTATGYFLGTPSYSSPEQVMGGKLDIHSDLFSFGTVAYEMLTGFLPFDGENLHNILYKIAHEPPTLKLDVFADYLDVHALSEVFKAIFDKDPSARFDSAHDFILELKNLLAPMLKREIPRDLLTLRGRKRKGRAGSSGNHAAQRPSSASHEKTVLSHPPDSEAVEDRVREARLQFRMALETGNLSSVRYSLEELKSLGIDTVEEEKMLAELEVSRRAEQEHAREQNRARLVEEARLEFRLALEARNPDSAGYCLKELKKVAGDVREEKQQLAALKQELADEEHNRTHQLEKQQEIEDLRWSFRRRLDKADLAGCRETIERISALEADTTDERRAYDALLAAEAAEEEQRASYIARTRRQFRDALEAEDPVRCQRLITELSSLLKVDVSVEKDERDALIRRIESREAEKLRTGRIEKLRKAFDAALADGDLETCKRRLKELKSLRADVVNETKALTVLRRRISGEKESELKERLIGKARAQFREALGEKNLEGCRYYLRELRQLVNDAGPEERALALLESMLEEEEADRLKRQIIAKHRANFKKAATARNLDTCRYYLRELRQLEADVTDELAKIAEIENAITAEEELQSKMINQSRERFREALSAGDATECEHYLNVLQELGAYTNDEQESLAELKREGTAHLGTDEKKAMISRFRDRFDQAYEKGDGDSCRFYLGELVHLNADVGKEQKKLGSI